MQPPADAGGSRFGAPEWEIRTSAFFASRPSPFGRLAGGHRKFHYRSPPPGWLRGRGHKPGALRGGGHAELLVKQLAIILVVNGQRGLPVLFLIQGFSFHLVVSTQQVFSVVL